jgi:hypothetical protein
MKRNSQIFSARLFIVALCMSLAVGIYYFAWVLYFPTDTTTPVPATQEKQAPSRSAITSTIHTLSVDYFDTYTSWWAKELESAMYSVELWPSVNYILEEKHGIQTVMLESKEDLLNITKQLNDAQIKYSIHREKYVFQISYSDSLYIPVKAVTNIFLHS